MTKEKKFESIYYELYNGMLKYAIHIIKDKYAAEDMVHSAFLELWIHMNEITCPPKWVSVTVMNKCLNYIKANQYEACAFDENKVQHLLKSSQGDDPVERTFYNIAYEQFLKELRDKSELWYMIIRRLFIENRSQGEVAELMDITPNDLRVVLHRIRKWIRAESELELYLAA